MDDIKSCVACGWGRSFTPQQEIEKQEQKHGEYICVNCEEVFESILNAPKGEKFTINKGYGFPCETLITDTNIYYFEGSRVADPNSSFLGFGGCWFLVTKTYPIENGEYRQMMVTNNLWHSRRVPVSYRERLRQANKIDSTVVGIERKRLMEFKKSLNDIPYLKDGE